MENCPPPLFFSKKFNLVHNHMIFYTQYSNQSNELSTVVVGIPLSRDLRTNIASSRTEPATVSMQKPPSSPGRAVNHTPNHLSSSPAPPLSQSPKPHFQRAHATSVDLFGLGKGEYYHAHPPTEKDRKQTPPWRKKRSNLPQHMKLAIFWRCDLLEPMTREETLNITFLRPRTARQQLKIDIYAARGLFKLLQTRTIELLAHTIKNQTHLRGAEYVYSMLLEALRSPKLAHHVQSSFECLLTDSAFEEATRSWNALHPYVTKNMFVPNDIALSKGSSLVQSEENRAIIAELRRQQDEHLHHHHHHNNNGHHHLKESVSTLPQSFFINSNSTDVKQVTDEADGGLLDLLFEESDGDSDEGMNTDYGISLHDARLLDYNEDAVDTAASYRLACSKYRTHPIKKFLRQLANDSINLSNLHLQHLHVQAVAETVPKLGHVHVLDLSGNNLRHDGGMVLAAAMIEHMRRLTDLNLSDNNIGPEAGREMAKAFFFMHALRKLNLSKNSLDDTVVEALSHSLIGIKSKSLDLDLSFNNLTCEGMNHLGRYFNTPNCCLETINLEWNQIGWSGCIVLADALTKNNRVSSLNLNFNKIGDIGACALIETLGRNVCLRHLSLNNNAIKAEAGHLFSRALPFCKALHSIDLSNNPLTIMTVNEIMRNLNGIGTPILNSINLNNTFHTASSTENIIMVPDLRAKKFSLNLADPMDHCVAEILRWHMLSMRWCNGSLNGAHLSQNQVQKGFARHGILTVNVGTNLVDPHTSEKVDQLEKLHHHGALRLELDMSVPSQKDVAIAQLITHRKKRMGAEPKNMSNAIKMQVAAEEQDMVVRHPRYNRQMFPHDSEEWFQMVKRGIITYELNESALKLYGHVKYHMNIVADRFELLDILQRISFETVACEYALKCRLKEEDREDFCFDVEKLNQPDFWEIREEKEKSKGTNKATDDAKKKPIPKRPMRTVRNRFYLPEKGILDLQLHSSNPVCVLSEFVELDVGKLNERNLANLYVWRNRCVVGEGIQDMLWNGTVRMAKFDEESFEFPPDGIITFIYIITRPQRALAKGRQAGRAQTNPKAAQMKNASGEFQLDLASDADRRRALLLRKLVEGKNTSTRSVWLNAKFDDEWLSFGRVIGGREYWELPKTGVLKFKFLPVARCVEEAKSKWLKVLGDMLDCGAHDAVRVDMIREFLRLRRAPNLKVCALRILIGKFEGPTGKQAAFELLCELCDDVLWGLLDFAEEIGYDPEDKVSRSVTREYSLQSPRRDRQVVVVPTEKDLEIAVDEEEKKDGLAGDKKDEIRFEEDAQRGITTYRTDDFLVHLDADNSSGRKSKKKKKSKRKGRMSK